MSKTIKKGVAKKATPLSLIAKQDFKLYANGKKFRGVKGEKVECLASDKEALLKSNFVKE